MNFEYLDMELDPNLLVAVDQTVSIMPGIILMQL